MPRRCFLAQASFKSEAAMTDLFVSVDGTGKTWKALKTVFIGLIL